jgi:hypothetical protein
MKQLPNWTTCRLWKPKPDRRDEAITPQSTAIWQCSAITLNWQGFMRWYRK